MKKTIKISAILLALIMAVSVFAISPISASAETSGWNTIWDAESGTGANRVGALSNSYVSTGPLADGATKILKSARSNAYNGASNKFSVSSGLSGATLLRVWLAGNEVSASTSSKGVVKTGFGIEITKDGTKSYYGLNMSYGYPSSYSLKTDGGFMTIDLTTAKKYAANVNNGFLKVDTNVNSSITSSDLENITGIYVVYGSARGDQRDKNEVYYTDKLQYSTSTEKPTASFTGTKSAVNNVSGFQITLPVTGVPTNDGYLVGWTANGKIYKPGSNVFLDGNTTFTAVGLRFEMTNGAGIRWATSHDDRGMRFQTRVNKEDVETLTASGAKFLTGTFISKHTSGLSDFGWGGGFQNVNGVNVGNYTRNNLSKGNGLDVQNTNNQWYDVDETYYYYYGGVVGMCLNNDTTTHEEDSSSVVTMKIAARSYVRITYSDGTVDDCLAKYDTGNNIRTMQQIANAALADTDFGYSASQIKILKEQYGATDGGSSSGYIKESKDALGK